jgi:hypothetical protein
MRYPARIATHRLDVGLLVRGLTAGALEPSWNHPYGEQQGSKPRKSLRRTWGDSLQGGRTPRAPPPLHDLRRSAVRNLERAASRAPSRRSSPATRPRPCTGATLSPARAPSGRRARRSPRRSGRASRRDHSGPIPLTIRLQRQREHRDGHVEVLRRDTRSAPPPQDAHDGHVAQVEYMAMEVDQFNSPRYFNM